MGLLISYKAREGFSDYLNYNDMIDARSLEIIDFCKGYLNKNERVLDIGSGTGWVAKHLRDLLRVEIRCIDVVNEHQTDVPFLLYNSTKIPFEDNEFDAALLIYTLHHCDDPLTVLTEAKRVSKGKIIVYEDIYTNPFNKLLAKIFDYRLNKKYNPKVRVPFNFRKEEEWVSLFQSLKLKIIDKKHISGNWRYPVKHIVFVLSK